MIHLRPFAVGAALMMMVMAAPVAAQDGSDTSTDGQAEAGSDAEKSAVQMTIDRLHQLIEAIDPDVKRQDGSSVWRMTVAETDVSVIADPTNDRMRIVVGITRAKDIPAKAIYRMMQANFDTALDARYAIAQGVLWATYIHPLSPLQDDQFISGLGQTVTLAKTAGSTYSSGRLSFGGGDSEALIEKELLEQLRKKGIEI